MREARSLIKQILIIIKNLDSKPRLKDIELIQDEKGVVTGYRLVIQGEPKLKLVKG